MFCVKPSFSRSTTSLRSKRPSIISPSCSSTSTMRGKSMSLIFSMPSESVCVTSRFSNRSTVRPGKASASPKIRRQQPVCPSMTALR